MGRSRGRAGVVGAQRGARGAVGGGGRARVVGAQRRARGASRPGSSGRRGEPGALGGCAAGPGPAVAGGPARGAERAGAADGREAAAGVSGSGSRGLRGSGRSQIWVSARGRRAPRRPGSEAARMNKVSSPCPPVGRLVFPAGGLKRLGRAGVGGAPKLRLSSGRLVAALACPLPLAGQVTPELQWGLETALCGPYRPAAALKLQEKALRENSWSSTGMECRQSISGTTRSCLLPDRPLWNECRSREQS